MDDLDSLFNKKQYQVVLDVTKYSEDPKERLMRISCFTILGEIDKALDEIEKYQSLIEKKYQLQLMKIHFELLLSKKLFDDAKLALSHYENLPYVSQEVEEFMREMKDRIEEESHLKPTQKFELDDICEILEKETDSGKVSQVLFSLKNYNINIYIDSLKIFMLRDDVNPNFRTYALILLIDEKYNEEILFKGREKNFKVNPSKLVPPFMSKNFNYVCEKIVKSSNNNVTLSDTALHLFNCYIIDTYPEEIYDLNLDNFALAFLSIAENYLGQESSYNEEIREMASKIKNIIESTPEIKL